LEEAADLEKTGALTKKKKATKTTSKTKNNNYISN
jgi:hypothetical protein